LKGDSACARLDWKHLSTAQASDEKQCEEELLGVVEPLRQFQQGRELPYTNELAGRLKVWCGKPVDTYIIQGGKSKYSETIVLVLSGCLSRVSYTLSALNGIWDENPNPRGGFLRSRIDFEVEAGKAYYVRLSFGMSDVANMMVVDTATGAKEIRGLSLAVP